MNTASQQAQFDILSQFEPLHPTKDPCRLPLFCGASIACNFPVPGRQGEIGLEIPIDIIVRMNVGARHAVEFKGGVVPIGVPIERQGNRVQWHQSSPRNSPLMSELSYLG
jgi:hypothetical protein